MRKVAALIMLMALAACAETSGGKGWGQIAYVDPLAKPHFGAIKTLEQPGIY